GWFLGRSGTKTRCAGISRSTKCSSITRCRPLNSLRALAQSAHCATWSSSSRASSGGSSSTVRSMSLSCHSGQAMASPFPRPSGTVLRFQNLSKLCEPRVESSFDRADGAILYGCDFLELQPWIELEHNSLALLFRQSGQGTVHQKF